MNDDLKIAGVSRGLDCPDRSEWLLDMVKGLTGVDVRGELIDPFAGGWEALDTYGAALTRVSRCLEDVCANVANVTETLVFHWKGGAADVAAAHFGSVGTSLERQSRAVLDAGARYRELAVGMRHHREAAEHLLKEVLDVAIEIAIWMAAGTAGSKTAAGHVIGYGMAAYRTAYLRQLIHEWRALVFEARRLANRAAQDIVRATAK